MGCSLPLEFCTLDLPGVAVCGAPWALCIFENWWLFCTPPFSHWFSLEIFIFSVTDKHKISASDESWQEKRKPLWKMKLGIKKSQLCRGQVVQLVGLSSHTPKGGEFGSSSGHIPGLLVPVWACKGRPMICLSFCLSVSPFSQTRRKEKKEPALLNASEVLKGFFQNLCVSSDSSSNAAFLQHGHSITDDKSCKML